MTTAAGRFGNAASPEVTLLIGTCEQRSWSREVRRCVRGVQTATDLATCVASTLDDGAADKPKVTQPAITVTASAAAQQLVAGSPEPIRVLVFLPDPSEVKRVVKGYFASFAAAGKLALEEHDRLTDAGLAAKYRVVRDGTIILARGAGASERSQAIEIDSDIDQVVRGKLPHFDREVRRVLARLLREPHIAYVTSGHGELTDPDAQPAGKKAALPERRASMFTKRLAELDYQGKDLGPAALAREIPSDATVVMVLAPMVALQPAEWAAIERYLDRGGALMIALDPKADPSLGPLEGRLGVRFDPADLTDDTSFLPQRHTASDHRITITNQFSAHASTTSLSRAASKGLVLLDAGALQDAPFTGKGDPPTKTFTIRSMDTSFLDYNNNFEFDAGGAKPEKRQPWNIAAAFEAPRAAGKIGYRAIVFADVDLFADVVVRAAAGTPMAMLLSGSLLDDSVRWLGGEPVLSGEPVGDDDEPEHLGPTAHELEEAEEIDRRVMQALEGVVRSKPADRDAALARLRAAQDEQAAARKRTTGSAAPKP
jgi:ABC-type uncharacterized transport system